MPLIHWNADSSRSVGRRLGAGAVRGLRDKNTTSEEGAWTSKEHQETFARRSFILRIVLPAVLAVVLFILAIFLS